MSAMASFDVLDQNRDPSAGVGTKLPDDVALKHFPIGSERIPYYFGSDLSDLAASLIQGYRPSRVLLVADSMLDEALVARYAAAIGEVAPLSQMSIAASEVTKNALELSRLLSWAVTSGADRATVIVAMGGGVVGNLVGLVAHLLFRGVRLVHVPTTYMAAFDSVLSMKQAVNIDGTKNCAGAFHLPAAIICDMDSFERLPAREIRSGLAESVKNALIARPEQVDMLWSLEPDPDRFGPVEHRVIWETSLDAKASFLQQDAHEKRGALIFEYGHTVGHAVEAASNGQLRHGEAVAIGLTAAGRVARKLGLIPSDLDEMHQTLLARFGLPRRLPSQLGLDRVERFLMNDNKRGYLPLAEDSIGMVMLGGHGEVLHTNQLPLIGVERQVVMSTLLELAD